ncbi:MAG: hypothetical protein C4534_09370 [Gaiellales bacterium]|nr:MAG: hypothetical protein C4534_09370 [Gaiellales bacterium]
MRASVGSENVPLFLTSAYFVIERVIRKLDDPQRQGGYFSVFDVEGAKIGSPLVSILVGDLPEAKTREKLEFSHEKAIRLAGHLNEGHLSSFQSKDEENGKWPGAVLIKGYFGDLDGARIFSFSGLPPAWDEAAMLLVGTSAHLIAPSGAKEIADISRNDVFFRIRPRWHAYG